MAILDAFTGAPARRAAEQSRAVFDTTQRNGLNDIQQGYSTSLGAIGAGYGGARQNLTGAYGTATGAVGAGTDAALGNIDSGTQGALGRLDSARGAYQPLSDLAGEYGRGRSLYQDALGINGADGNQRATDAFTPSLSYNFNLDQGLEAINRARNARGMANSGNTDRDAQTFGAGLASKEQGAWLDRLAGFINPELQATSGAATGMAGVDTNAANVLRDAGTAKAGLESGRGAMLADLAKWYGGAQAGADTGEGNALAGLATNAATQRLNLGTGLAQPYANTYGQEAQAQMAGSANAIRAGISLASLAAGGVGGLGGLGGLAGGAGGMGLGAGASAMSTGRLY